MNASEIEAAFIEELKKAGVSSVPVENVNAGFREVIPYNVFSGNSNIYYLPDIGFLNVHVWTVNDTGFWGIRKPIVDILEQLKRAFHIDLEWYIVLLKKRADDRGFIADGYILNSLYKPPIKVMPRLNQDGEGNDYKVNERANLDTSQIVRSIQEIAQQLSHKRVQEQSRKITKDA